MPKPTEIFNIIGQDEWQGLLSLRESRTVRISSAGVTADANGKKIVPAGTPLGSATAGKTILGDNAPAKPANNATTEGLAVHTVDVTNGDAEVAMAYVATVNQNKLPVALTTLALGVMKRTTFMDV